MRAHPFLRLASLAGAIAVVPSFASAQLAGGVVVTPYIGAYTPTNQIARTGITTQGTSLTADIKHQTAAAFGANVSYWINDRFAIEGGGVYTTSNLRSSLSINNAGVNTSGAQTDNAHVWLGSVKVMMQLLPPESDFNLRFGIGPAIISRGGSAYKGDSEGQVTGLTDYGAAASLCTRFSFTPNVAIRLRAEDYMYYTGMGWRSSIDPAENFGFDSRMQHDFIFSAGLQLFLKR
jgi:outer membrane protein W